MSLRILPNCAYCDKPLHLIAGFCSACTAPARVAQRTYLIADARRQAGIVLSRHSEWGQRIEPSPQSSVLIAMQQPQPRWLRILAVISVLAFAATIMLMNLQATGNALPLFHFPAQTTLTATVPNDTNSQNLFASGQTMEIHYGLQVPQSNSIITIIITPQHGKQRSMTERVTQGEYTRTLQLVPLVADIWHITLELDSHKVQSLDITVYTP